MPCCLPDWGSSKKSLGLPVPAEKPRPRYRAAEAVLPAAGITRRPVDVLVPEGDVEVPRAAGRQRVLENELEGVELVGVVGEIAHVIPRDDRLVSLGIERKIDEVGALRGAAGRRVGRAAPGIHVSEKRRDLGVTSRSRNCIWVNVPRGSLNVMPPLLLMNKPV